MITVKLEIDPGDGSKPVVTAVQVDPSQLQAVQRAMKLVAAMLRDNPETIVSRLIGASIGRTIAKGLGKILAGKSKR